MGDKPKQNVNPRRKTMPFDNANVPESKTTRVLKKARELITPRERWTVGERHGLGGAMCAIGAIEEAGDYGHNCMYSDTPEIELLARHAKPVLHGAYERRRGMAAVAHLNNEKGHEATLAMFDAAITDSMALDAQAALA